jgi:predicted DNA-binding transcriptional regulator YafY
LGKRSQRSKLTREEARDIEKKLRRTGVQYLVGQESEILLRLTEAGQREFTQRSYMRPNPDSVEGDLYRFSCTERQIRNYFFSFGRDVQILEPESLRREFLEGYRQALAVYE